MGNSYQSYQCSPHTQPQCKDYDSELMTLNAGLIGPVNSTQVSVCGLECSALLDTGSQVTTISSEFVQSHPKLKAQSIQSANITIEGAGGQAVPHLGFLMIDIEVRDLGITMDSVPALVVPRTADDGRMPCLLGTNVLRAARDKLHQKHGRQFMAKVKSCSATWFSACSAMNSDGLDLAAKDGTVGTLRYVGGRPITIPPGHQRMVSVQAPRVVGDRTFVGLVEEFSPYHPINVETCFALVRDQKAMVMVANHTGEMIRLRSNCPIAKLQIATLMDGPPLEGPDCDHLHYDHKDDKENPGILHPIVPGLKLPDDMLSSGQRDALEKLLSSNSDIFSTGPQDFGHTRTISHEIPLIDPTPFRMPYRRIHPKDFNEVRDHLQELQDAGVIKPSKSPFASPIVIVRKKDGQIRMCVDYRKLNSRTTRDAYPIPRIEESLDALGGAKYFSSLDLMSGYLQVEMEETDQAKTAFTTPLGLFEYTRMPFGLMNAPATFQRLMNTVLGDLNLSEVLIYLDDIIVFSDTIEEHIARLDRVFTRLREHGLKLKPSKCHLLVERVRYLGHIVSKEGIATDPEKSDAVEGWPVPKTVKDVRSFLGFTGYYRRFIPRYASIARPLFELLGGKRKPGKHAPAGPFKWTGDCQEAFENLKRTLTSAPVLAYPDFSKAFILQTDASLEGFGAVLAQEHDGQERVVAFASRSLQQGERRYPAHKLEFKALHWAATVKFRDYVYGQRVVAVTDNNPLTYVLKSAKLDAHGQRWVNDLSQCNLEITYRPGKANDNADSLSRIPVEEVHRVFNQAAEKGSTTKVSNLQTSVKQNDAGTQTNDCQTHNANLPDVAPAPTALSSSDVAQAQSRDKAILRVRELMERGHKPTRRQASKEVNHVRKILQRWGRLSLVKGVLHYRPGRDDSDPVPVVPRSFKKNILEGVHDRMGHLGYERTLDLAKHRYYWVGMASDVKLHLHQCKRCALRKTADPQGRTPLTNIRTSRPLELVCMDFLSLETSAGGIENVLVVTDHFTRHAQAFPTRDQTALTVARTLWRKYIIHYGIPERIHSDQGKCFQAAIIQELCTLLGMEKSRTTPYHPQGNGMTERFNSTLLNMLGTLQPSQKTDWKEHVETLTHAYNCTKHSSTGYSPFYLMFMREPRIALDLAHTKEEEDDWGSDEVDYVARLRHTLEEAHRQAEINAEEARKKQKRQHDKRTRPAEFAIGDRVLVANKGLRGRRKIADRWETDPYLVVRKIDGSPVYVVRECNSEKERTLHQDLLTLCTFPSSDCEDEHVAEPNDPQLDADDESSSVCSSGTDTPAQSS